jgi:Flp pilus assembly protein TadG
MSRGRSSESESGHTAVEFALVAPLVVALLFTALFLLLHAFYSAVADHGARDTARFAAIQVQGGNGYPDDAAIAAKAAALDTLLGTPQSVVVDRRSGASGAGTCAPDAGAANPCGEGDVVTVTIVYSTPALAQMPLVPSSAATITRVGTARFE